MNRLRLSIGIFRILLLLVSFQFLSPAFGLSQNAKKETSTFHHAKAKSHSLNFLFEKNEGEELEDTEDKESESIPYLTRSTIISNLIFIDQTVVQQLQYTRVAFHSKACDPLYLQHSLLLI